jgi:hypothetical protein
MQPHAHNRLHQEHFASLPRIVALATVPCPFGPGDWWVGEIAEHAVAIVVPGVIASPDEDPARARWRTVWWPIGVEAPPPDPVVRVVEVVEVRGLLDERYHDRLRMACRSHLEQLRRYSSSMDGRPDEDRARSASQFLTQLHSELRAAFPGEPWHAEAGTAFELVPETAAEFLREVERAGTPLSRAERGLEQLQRFYWAAVHAYRDARRFGVQGQRILRAHVRSEQLGRAGEQAADKRDASGERPCIGKR